MTEIDELIEKHRASQLLIGANLLLLCLLGRMNPRRIASHKHTSSLTLSDYRVLEVLIAQFQRILTTPHILTEVSNLAGRIEGIREFLCSWIEVTPEEFEPSSELIDDPAFKNFGLADAAISSLCKRGGILLLTADLPLYGALTNRGFDVISFKQIQAINLMR